MWDLLQYGDRIAIRQNDKEYTYSDLHKFSEQIAEHAEKDVLAFIVCTNTVGSIAGYLGFLNHHIVPVLVDHTMDLAFLQHLLETYRPAYLWVPKNRADEHPEFTRCFSSCEYVLLKTDYSDSPEVNPDLALLINTSGSTGSPKLVRQSYANLKANTQSIIEYLKIDENERAITSLPMHYVYGLSIINTHLWAGARLVLTELNCYTKQFWDLVDSEGVTSFAGVPFMYEMIDKLSITKRDIPSLKTMTQAGGKLLPALHRKMAEYAQNTDKRFIVMYGASEATARMGYLPSERSLEKEGSMGVPIPGGRFELIDGSGQIIDEAETVGELVYYGKNVVLGYALCKEDLAKGDENHGRLETGDMAKKDNDGFYYIVGRKKRFVKMLGKRINMDEIERLLKSELNVIDLACGGKDDDLKIFVVDDVDQQRIIDFISERIQVNRNLVHVKKVDEIPKNASGKILYSALNEM